MKKITSLFFAFVLIVSLLSGCGHKSESDEFLGETVPVDCNTDNPIDRAFAKDFKDASATAEIDFVAETYLTAWKAELENVSGLIKKEYPQKEDAARVDAFTAASEKLVESSFDLEMLNWIDDVNQPLSKRTFGTGGPGAAMTAQGKIYKQAALHLIDHYQAMPGEKTYKYIYSGNGAEIDKLRKQQ